MMNVNLLLHVFISSVVGSGSHLPGVRFDNFLAETPLITDSLTRILKMAAKKALERSLPASKGLSPEGESLDDVRELLFGRQQRQMQEQLARAVEEVSRQSSMDRNELAGQLRQLEVSNERSIDAVLATQAAAVAKLRSDTDASMAKLLNRLSELEASHHERGLELDTAKADRLELAAVLHSLGNQLEANSESS